MGNIGTKSDVAQIFVQTNEPYYAPHSYVEGSVYLEVFQPSSASHIDLIVKAKEKVKWEEVKQPGSGSQQSISEIVKDYSRVFESYKVPLHTFGGNIAPGQYQFPFAFQLPEGIPGSFKLHHDSYEGSVTYSLTALLVIPEKPELKHKTHFVIKENLSIPNYNSPATATQSLCVFCLPKGNCRMECIFQSDTFKSGDEAYVMCKVDNSACSVPIKIFVLDLIQHVTLRVRSGKETHFKRTVAQKEFDGLEAGAANFDRPKLLSVVLAERQIDLMSTQEEKEKLALQPNVKGRLIECRYTVEVYPVFDANCTYCSKFPRVVLPLHVYARAPPGWVQEPPKEFKPIQYEVQQIIIPMNPVFDVKPKLEETKIKLNETIEVDKSVSLGESAAKEDTIQVKIEGPNTGITSNPPAPPSMEVNVTSTEEEGKVENSENATSNA